MNYMDDGTEGTIKKFANVTKLGGAGDTPNFVLWFRGTLTCWIKGLTGTAERLTRGNAKSCMWGSNPRHHDTLQGWAVCASVNKLESSSAGSSHRVLVENNLTMSQQCAFIS